MHTNCYNLTMRKSSKSNSSNKKNISITRSSAAEYLTFIAATGDSEASVEMRYEDENIWLTQKMMATLYHVDVRTISEHLKKIFADNEVLKDSVVRKFRITECSYPFKSLDQFRVSMRIL